jgi:hypothetical protein
MGDKQLSIPYQEQGATRLHGEYTAVNSIPGTEKVKEILHFVPKWMINN